METTVGCTCLPQVHATATDSATYTAAKLPTSPVFPLGALLLQRCTALAKCALALTK